MFPRSVQSPLKTCPFDWRCRQPSYMEHQINSIASIATVHFCASWTNNRYPSTKLSASLSPHVDAVRSPCMVLPPMVDEFTGKMKYCFFNVVDKSIFNIKKPKSSVLPHGARCFWSSHGWLAFFVESRYANDNQLYLWNPFTYSSNVAIRLPSMKNLHHGSLDQLAFSSAPSPNNSGCTMMAVQALCDRNHLAFCKLGDTAWTHLNGPLFPYELIKYSIKDQLFYAMGNEGQIEAWDLRDLSSIKRIPIDDNYNSCAPRFSGLEAALRDKCFKKYYLVESSGDLLLVQRHLDNIGITLFNYKYSLKTVHKTVFPKQTYRFDVYKLDSSLRWNYVKCLGDRALFVGLGDTFSVCAHDFPGLMPNSIYFADDETRNDKFILGGHDMGIYDLDDNSMEPFYPFGCLKKIEPPPVWVAPNLHSY